MEAVRAKLAGEFADWNHRQLRDVVVPEFATGADPGPGRIIENIKFLKNRVTTCAHQS
jgi:hypothetical protein